MKLPIRQVAEWLGLETASDAVATGWSVDSRTVQAGDLFIALRGTNHDGNKFVADAFEKGAVAVLVDRQASGGEAPEGRVLRVEDPLQALQQLSARARQSWRGRLVA